ncbi:VTT domain-containing protein [Tardiphaga sp. 709]|uniref:VTT domain-containing protein n=1 Tax=Tardiphaga sp. 709 TaxID=3076039 RepID=UPI0028EC1A72|nr:VTT domain-containing protein [Tardiphaga sp. 709]WNV09183.1 VTT domain-containing protein [Tardiphaga sp. 709]
MSSERIVQWLESFGQLDLPAAVVLAALVVASSFLPVPRTFVVLGAGAAFGLRSLVVILPVAAAASALAFMLARSVLRGWVERQTEKHAAWRLVAQAVDDEGWRIVALMRFGGPLPNSVQNYLFGLTNIGLLPFALVTFLFTLPQIVFYVYLGASGRALLLDDGPVPLNRVLIAMTLVIVLVILLLVSRRIRAILARKTGIATCGTVSN